MKKFLIFSLLVIVFGGILFVSLPNKTVAYAAVGMSEVASEVETQKSELNEETENSSYFREKIMPYITANLTGIISAVIVVFTTLGKIKAATTELKASNAENVYLKKKNMKLEEDIVQLKEDIKVIKKDTANTKEMVRIGFCNSTELVANGYAEEIAKVGENEEESKS